MAHHRQTGEAQFEHMLAEISREVASLPFSAGTGASLPYDRSIGADARVLYHAFIYLRHVLSESAPREEQLLPALRCVLADPQRRFQRYRRVVPLHRARAIGPHTLRQIVTAQAELQRAQPGVAPALAQALDGHLPQVEETAVQSTVDVPENRFVKAFVEQAIGIVESM